LIMRITVRMRVMRGDLETAVLSALRGKRARLNTRPGIEATAGYVPREAGLTAEDGTDIKA